MSTLPDLPDSKTSFRPSDDREGRALLSADRVSGLGLPVTLPRFPSIGRIQRFKRSSVVANTNLPSAETDGSTSCPAPAVRRSGAWFTCQVPGLIATCHKFVVSPD